MLELATMSAEPRNDDRSRATSRTVAPLAFSTAMRKGRILIVDDENGPRQALRMLLKEDHEVYLASSVAAAMEFLQGETVDIIITDIRMPGTDGLALLQSVQDTHPNLPVIIMTGHGDIPMAVEAIKLGAFHFLEKPLDPEQLGKAIAAALASKQKSGEVASKKRQARQRLETLTDRQREILTHIAKGLTSKEVAAVLGVSYRTVETHRAWIMTRLEATSLADLVRLVITAEWDDQYSAAADESDGGR